MAASRYRGFPVVHGRTTSTLRPRHPGSGGLRRIGASNPRSLGDEDTVLDRISGTVRLNMVCLRGGERRGIADRFVPVLQGWHPHHYLRCLERMPWVLDRPIVGIGSMCRRHVHGEHGVLHVLDVLDRAFSGSDAKWHLFGLKSQAIAVAAQHPAWPALTARHTASRPRQTARKAKAPKTDAMVAATMACWYRQQMALILARPPLPPRQAWDAPAITTQKNAIESRVAEATERLRELHEDGEVEWTDVSSQAAYEMAFLDD